MEISFGVMKVAGLAVLILVVVAGFLFGVGVSEYRYNKRLDYLTDRIVVVMDVVDKRSQGKLDKHFELLRGILTEMRRADHIMRGWEDTEMDAALSVLEQPEQQGGDNNH